MAKGYSGMGPRLREAILRRYPSVRRFCLERRFSEVYVYRWMAKGHIPEYGEMMRLCSDLDVTPAWLLFGDDAHKVPTPPNDGADVVVGKRAPARGRAGRATVKGLVGALALGAALLGGPSIARASAPASPYPSTTGLTTLRLIGRARRRRSCLAA